MACLHITALVAHPRTWSACDDPQAAARLQTTRKAGQCPGTFGGEGRKNDELGPIISGVLLVDLLLEYMVLRQPRHAPVRF